MAEKENRVSFPCSACNRTFVADLPPTEIWNGQSASVVVLAHPELTICPHCGQAFLYVLRTLTGVEFGFVAVEVKEKDSGLVLPTASLVDLLRKKN